MLRSLQFNFFFFVHGRWDALIALEYARGGIYFGVCDYFSLNNPIIFLTNMGIHFLYYSYDSIFKKTKKNI